MEKQRTYVAIDLKSFYASVECVERGLDPLTTNLVVADAQRTNKTICLAVSPSLKSFGIPGRPRLFEVVRQVDQVNALRRLQAPGGKLEGSSCYAPELEADRRLALDYIVAPPRMAMYMEYSARVYQIYLRFVAPEDIHVYSVDEVFIDLTPYLGVSRLTAEEFTRNILRAVVEDTGITATAGIGSNLYLCKVAMDIVAKKAPPDDRGARIAQLTEESYRQLLWDHQPLTDFWRVGPGYSRRLQKAGLFTMGDIARCSLGAPEEAFSEELLYQMFGVNAELLIDHAWGWESCTMADIKAYRPAVHSLSTGQVLHCPYDFQKTRLILREMADGLALDLVEKGLLTDHLTLTVGYDVENLRDPEKARAYQGAVTMDHYGRAVPRHAHGSVPLEGHTASTSEITGALLALFDRIADPALLVRRLTLGAEHVLPEGELSPADSWQQLDLFGEGEEKKRRQACRDRELRRQKAVLHIKRKYGKNAILRGMNFLEGATAAERNRQVGGHKA